MLTESSALLLLISSATPDASLRNFLFPFLFFLFPLFSSSPSFSFFIYLSFFIVFVLISSSVIYDNIRVPIFAIYDVE